MTDPNKTAIAVIIDESGSMGGRQSAVIEGFNALIADQRKLPGSCTVSLTKFATFGRVVFTDLDIASVRNLTSETYRPDGSTALFDAIGKTIEDLGARLAGLSEDQRPGKVVVVIITDGEENASTDYQQEKIQAMVKHQTDAYNWTFNFMGCTIEAMKGAIQIGISITNTVQFGATNSVKAFAAYSSKLSTTRGLMAKGAGMETINASMCYNDDDRAAVK